MDSPTVVSVASTIGILLGSLAGTVVVRRNAKDKSAVDGYAKLAKALEDRMLAGERRQDDLQAEIDELQTYRRNQRSANRNHEGWDRQVMRRLRDLTGEDIPEPPPLDV